MKELVAASPRPEKRKVTKTHWEQPCQGGKVASVIVRFDDCRAPFINFVRQGGGLLQLNHLPAQRAGEGAEGPAIRSLADNEYAQRRVNRLDQRAGIGFVR